jgi:hypothetical protein
MLWTQRDLEAEQVPIPSPDLTGAIIKFPERDVLVVSVYVEGRNEQGLYVCMYVCIFFVRGAIGPEKSPRGAQDVLS